MNLAKPNSTVTSLTFSLILHLPPHFRIPTPSPLFKNSLSVKKKRVGACTALPLDSGTATAMSGLLPPLPLPLLIFRHVSLSSTSTPFNPPLPPQAPPALLHVFFYPLQLHVSLAFSYSPSSFIKLQVAPCMCLRFPLLQVLISPA